MFNSVLNLAKTIASKSPIAIYGIKRVLNQNRKYKND